MLQTTILSKRGDDKKHLLLQALIFNFNIMKKYKLPELPYNYSDLEPAISKRIMTLHHNKHHAGYVKKANLAYEKLVQEKEINRKHILRDLSFNLNGHLLHTSFWNSMTQYNEDNNPPRDLKDQLTDRFDSFKKFKELFHETASTV